MSTIVAEAPKPGYLTTEFWGTTLVHILAFVATLLDLLNVHWAHGLSAVQAAVPVLALAISASLQTAYHDKRLALKMDHTAQATRAYIAELDHGYDAYEPVIARTLATVRQDAPLVEAVDPAAKPVVDEVDHVAATVEADEQRVLAAWHGDMRDAAPEAPATA